MRAAAISAPPKLFERAVMTIVLPPLAWSQFELSSPPARRDWLALVNRMVNRGIEPNIGPVPGPTEPWRLWPVSGWCHDYAVTKRYELMLRGYSASELILCQCIADEGQHMVLLAGGLALDNLTDELHPMRYRIVRKQSAVNPDEWESA